MRLWAERRPKIQERSALFRVGNASAINPGQPMKKLAQPVPHTGGAPGNGFNERAACGALTCFAVLGTLHAHFMCAYWK